MSVLVLADQPAIDFFCSCLHRRSTHRLTVVGALERLAAGPCRACSGCHHFTLQPLLTLRYNALAV